jgi:Penicillin binding protein transpeptidase domain/NTF2-like N-terminal transpeptidase domain
MMRLSSGGPMGRGRLTALIVGAVAVVLVLAGAGVFWVLRTEGSPRQTATEFLTDWRKGDFPAMRRLSVGSPADLAATYTQMNGALGVTAVRARAGAVKPGSPRIVPFTAALTLRSGGTWTYQGELSLIQQNRRWRVAWTPAAVHPRLAPGRQLALAAVWPSRGHILAADGSRIDVPGVSGSVQQLAGLLGPATDADVRRLGPPYKQGDPVGQGGLQQAMERRLAGVPSVAIRLVGGGPAEEVGRLPGSDGAEVRTSLDPGVQSAAAKAITQQGKPAALVALRPSTGEILAAANQPGGFNRALMGQYPPGSTFKVVTGAALLSAGLHPGDQVTCAQTVNIGGRSFSNFEGEQFGTLDFLTAFARSCNTAFATEATRRLKAAGLAKAARDFGFGIPITPGVPAARGVFPQPKDDAEFAAASFGQGRVLASPLNMAAVAAAVENGAWRPPMLVTGGPRPPVRSLKAEVTSGLRTMMAAVVTQGTAKDAGLPAGTSGKTGTAEFGTGAKPPTHAWFIGYRGDLAFAVIVEDGGTGGGVAAPLAAAFLKSLPSL